ncbi:MAG TPA: MarR family transcriptional regulator [Chloroflexota bacterium]
MNRTEHSEFYTSPSDAELQFVEEVALNFERQGLFRMAGRVLGWLLICDPPEQSFNQLVEVLQASKGSISTAMRILVPGGIVEKVSRPGERRDYYRVEPGAWIELARNSTKYYAGFKNLAEEGLQLLDDAPPARRARLEDIHALYDWLSREMPEVWARWEQERQKREDTP